MSVPRAWFQRRTAALIAALCLVGQLCGLAHLLVVKHVRCATHGEVVHVARSIHATHAAQHDAPLLAQDERSPAGADDDHCAWLTDHRSVRLGSPAVLAVTQLATLAPTGVIADRIAAPTRPLYRLAPKVSPPTPSST